MIMEATLYKCNKNDDIRCNIAGNILIPSRLWGAQEGDKNGSGYTIHFKLVSSKRVGFSV